MAYKAIFFKKQIGENTTHFTLIGRPKTFFKLTWDGRYSGIPCVQGEYYNAKGKRFHALARIEDVKFHTIDDED